MDLDERRRREAKGFSWLKASVIKTAAALKRKIVSVRTRSRVLGCPFPPLRVVRQKWADTTTFDANQDDPRRRPAAARFGPAGT
jgi:hypothetical protein